MADHFNISSNGTNFTFAALSNTSSAPPGCLVLHYQDFLPWDNPTNVISAETEDLVRRLKDAVVLPILFLIGGPANVLNMAVFYKQSLKERINVCLFALSLADFLYLLQTIIFRGENIDFNRKERYGPITQYTANHNLVGFFGFTWVSQVISAIIASERCFCILKPLRSQNVLRTSTTVAIIVVVYVVVVGLYFLVVSRYRIACVYDPVRQVSFMSGVAGQFYLDHQKLIDYLDAFVYGAGLPGVMMVVVTTTTIITTIKLRQAAAWRAVTSSSGSMTSQEIALTRMLVGNSVLFIVCISPIALFRFAWLFLPDINVGGRQHNLFLVSLWLLDVFSNVNSTFNFFVYYVMGSRFRDTLWGLLRRKTKKAAAKKSEECRTSTTEP